MSRDLKKRCPHCKNLRRFRRSRTNGYTWGEAVIDNTKLRVCHVCLERLMIANHNDQSRLEQTPLQAMQNVATIGLNEVAALADIIDAHTEHGE